MKVNTALGFVFSGLSLFLLKDRSSSVKEFAGYLLASLVTLIGFLSIIEYLAGTNPGIDQLIIQDECQAMGTVYPGRMSINTALNFLLIGISLLLINNKLFNMLTISQIFSVIAGIIGFIAIIGHIYQA